MFKKIGLAVAASVLGLLFVAPIAVAASGLVLKSLELQYDETQNIDQLAETRSELTVTYILKDGNLLVESLK